MPNTCLEGQDTNDLEIKHASIVCRSQTTMLGVGGCTWEGRGMKKGLATRKDEKDNRTTMKKNIRNDNEIEIEVVEKKK